MNLVEQIQIIPYKPGYQPHFERLNRYWIEKFFRMEPVDEAVLEDPDRHIIAPGGDILFASVQNHIAGTVALRRQNELTAEMTKMAVDEAYQGKKIGLALGRAVLERAAGMGFKRVVLYSNRVLAPAIQLYRKLGFREIPVDPGIYDRCNIQMEIWLDAPLHETARALEQVLDTAAPQLRQYSAAEAEQRPAPGKWSKKEILGHLIDSALNNHIRFVRAQRQPLLEMPGYEQDDWVRIQGYQQADWATLIDLWEAMNRNIARIITLIPSATIQHTCKIGSNEPVTLEYLVHDYLAHLQHHLGQLQVTR